MRMRLLVPVLFAWALALLGATPSAPFEEIDEGNYRIDWRTIDDLLTIQSHADLNVIVLEDNKSKSLSDAHMKMVRQWVTAVQERPVWGPWPVVTS